MINDAWLNICTSLGIIPRWACSDASGILADELMACDVDLVALAGRRRGYLVFYDGRIDGHP
jgi:hypothetical protein